MEPFSDIVCAGVVDGGMMFNHKDEPADSLSIRDDVFLRIASVPVRYDYIDDVPIKPSSAT